MINRLFIALCLFFSICHCKETTNVYLNFIKESLNSDNIAVKTEAIRTISSIGDKSSISRLKKMLNDQSDTIKIETAVALYKLGDNSGKDILIKILEEKPNVSMKDSPVKRAKALAKNLIRAQAAKALGEINDKSAIPVLKEISKNDDGRVVDESIISLIKLGDRSGVDMFITGLYNN